MKSKKILTVVAVALLVTAVLVGSVYAYLNRSVGPVTNDFAADSDLDPTIQETFEAKTADGLPVKEDVSVKVGDLGYTVFVRAAIVITWKDVSDPDDVKVYSALPVAGTDYSLELNETKWFFQDGFYYYPDAVAANGSTDVLIESCEQLETAVVPYGYQLSVEIIAQTIQSEGTTDGGAVPAATNAWGVTVTNDKLVKSN